MVSLYNRLGGHVLRWSKLKGQMWGAATLPIDHDGQFYNVEMKVIIPIDSNGVDTLQLIQKLLQAFINAILSISEFLISVGPRDLTTKFLGRTTLVNCNNGEDITVFVCHLVYY